MLPHPRTLLRPTPTIANIALEFWQSAGSQPNSLTNKRRRRAMLLMDAMTNLVAQTQSTALASSRGNRVPPPADAEA